jgi:hypothetical protein
MADDNVVEIADSDETIELTPPKKHATLQVFTCEASKKLAEKLYYSFFGKEDFKRFPAYIYYLDQLLFDLGAKPLEEIEKEREEKENPKPSEPTKQQDDGASDGDSDNSDDKETAAAIRSARQELISNVETAAVNLLHKEFARIK